MIPVGLGYIGQVGIEDDFQRRIAELKQRRLWRSEAEVTGCQAGRKGKLPLDLTSNDYLGLSRDNVSRETLLGAVDHPLGAGSSRVVSNGNPALGRLEELLAGWVGAESALLFTSGYSANLGVLCALPGPEDLLISDELNHASIVDGCRLSRARVAITEHCSAQSIEAQLAAHGGRGRCWVVTESYFSMDGTSPDLSRLSSLCTRYDAGLIVDESHALGVHGPRGAGLCALARIRPDVVTAGLGKAVGAQGGFVAVSGLIRSWLWNRARTHFFSTGFSPLLATLVASAVSRAVAADAEREVLARASVSLEGLLRGAGCRLPEGRHGPVFPLLMGGEEQTLAAASKLSKLGIRVQPIRPPTVPVGSSRLRVSLRANLRNVELETLAGALSRFCGKEAQGGVPKKAVKATRRARRWVVLGCGTEVGKTYVASALVDLLRSAGCRVAGLKPVETGLSAVGTERAPLDSDAGQLSSRSFHVKLPSPHPLYGYREPVTPSRAARLEARPISIDRIRDWLEHLKFDLDAKNGDLRNEIVVETAGGVFSPLSDSASNLDLARKLEPANLILVAVDRLGVLNEIVTTLRAMKAAGRSPDWIVLTAPKSADASTGTNAGELLRLTEFRKEMKRLLVLGWNEPGPLRNLLEPNA